MVMDLQAMRYTEARLQRLTESMLSDLDKDTVNFQFNFDDTEREPTVPSYTYSSIAGKRLSGIAVGMATNMLPHNLSESIDGCIAYIDNRNITIEELMQYVKAPDFPTGGIIYGMEGVKAAMHLGRGRVVVRGKMHVDTKASGREQIIVTETPTR
jgi:DNA gyrase subunit A